MTSVSTAQLPPAFQRAPKEVQEAYIRQREEGARARTSVQRWEAADKGTKLVLGGSAIGAVTLFCPPAGIALAGGVALTGCDPQKLPPEIPPRDFDTEIPGAASGPVDDQFPVSSGSAVAVRDLNVQAGNKTEAMPVLTVGYTNRFWKYNKFNGSPNYLALDQGNFDPSDTKVMSFGLCGPGGPGGDTIISEAEIWDKAIAVMNADGSSDLEYGEWLIFPRIFVRAGTVSRTEIDDIFGSTEHWKNFFINPADDVLIFHPDVTMEHILELARGFGLSDEKEKKLIEIFDRYLGSKNPIAVPDKKDICNPLRYLKGQGAEYFYETGLTLQAPYYFHKDFQWRVYVYADRDIISQTWGGPEGRVLDPDISSMNWWTWSNDPKGAAPQMWLSRPVGSSAVNAFNTIPLISGASIEQKHDFLDGTEGASLPELPAGWPPVPDKPAGEVPEDGLVYYNTERNIPSASNTNGFVIEDRSHSGLIYAAPNIPIVNQNGEVVGNECHSIRNLHVQFLIRNTGFAAPDNTQGLYCNINFFQQNTE